MIAVVDAGPLYAVTDADDDHERCAEALSSPPYRLVIPQDAPAPAVPAAGTHDLEITVRGV